MRPLIVLCLVPAIALANPATLQHQGRLTNTTGEPIEGTVDLDVGVYASQTGGTALFSERFDNLPVSDGYFSVTLGAGDTPLASSVFDGDARWMALTVDDGTPFARTPLSSVPYARFSDRAQRTVSFTSSDCDAANTGALEYRDATDGLFLCDGNEWFRIGTGAPVGTWAAPAYAYKNVLTIQGSTGAGSGYAVRLTIGNQAGAGPVDAHVNGNAANFPTGEDEGGDLAFYNSAGDTPLPFWVESVSEGVATVWVKVAEDLGVDREIQLYYGNASAPNLSDGTATFLLFDDFEASAVNTALWNVDGQAAISGGQLVVGNTSQGHDFVNSVDTFGVGTQMVWKGRINNEGWTFSRDGLKDVVAFLSAWNQSQVQTWMDGDVRNIPGTNKGGTYHFQVARPLDGSGRGWLDGVVQDMGPVVSTDPATAGWHSGTQPDLVQYVLVAPFVEPQPSVSAASGEVAQ